MLEKAVAIWPDYARGWQLLADAYAATGDEARANDARHRADEAASRAPAGDEPL
jgi:predicted Zn-dependent protease